MARERKRQPRRQKSDRTGVGIKQLPWRNLENPHQPFCLLNEEQMDLIHKTSMRILSEHGIRVMGDNVMDCFEQAGAIVDRDKRMIRMDESLIMEAIKTAPSEFTITPRNEAHKVVMGGRHINFGLVAGPPNVHDMINGRRRGNLEDFIKFTKLAQHFNVINMIGNQVVAPVELPANNRHLDTYNANITYTDKAFHCTAIGRGRVMDAVKMCAIARGKTLEALKTDPSVVSIISVNSPRLFDDAMGDGLIALAESGQVATITPFTLMGAMTPVTLPAALAQQNAEALFGVALTQLVNPGAPVMYGSFTSNVDMRSGAPAFGTPENTKANIVGGQLARRYGIPYRTSNANASNCVDLQATYETLNATWGAVLGGANIIYHAAGWLEGGLTASFEKVILDVEILQQVSEFLQPMDLSEGELGMEAIADVDAGGHFFGTEHTMARYETAFYQPILSDWTNYENWELAGAEDSLTRATKVWQQALEDYELPAMDPAIREELDSFMAKRKTEIGSEEP